MKPDYTNSVVCKIVCLDPNITDLYVGSTTNFTVRKYGHKNSCLNVNNKHHNLYVYTFIRDNGGFENWQFVVVRRYNNIKTKEELLRKERKYIDKLKPTLNKHLPLQTPAEYYVKNKEKIIEQVKEYRLENKEKVTEYQKEYFQKNKDGIRQKKKEYRETNEEQIKRYKNEKIECECGCLIGRSNLALHKQSKKHKQLMEDK